MIRKVFFLAALGWLTAMTGVGPLHAEDRGRIVAPKGRVILTISGVMDPIYGEQPVRFDLASFEALGMVDLHTTTPWEDGVVVYSGPLARTVLERVGNQSAMVLASALNEYRIEIPVQDFYDYDVILATRRDGEIMSIRDKGPIFIVYPFIQDSNLMNEETLSRSVWQLNALELR